MGRTDQSGLIEQEHAMTMLLNGLCLGMVLAMVIWGALKLAPGVNAATRHVILWMTLVAVIALPFVGLVGKLAGQAAPGEMGIPREPMNEVVPTVRDDFQPKVLDAGQRPAERPEPDHRQWEPVHVAADGMVWVVGGIWLTLSMALAVRLMMSYRWMRRVHAQAAAPPAHLESRFQELRHSANMSRATALKVSADVTGPVVLGLTHPAVVFPGALARSISEEDFDQVALHELAHVARYDDWTNFLQRVLEVLLPIQPAVMWIGRQIGLEREAACDDRVVGVTGEAKSYAVVLSRVAELTLWSSSRMLASGTIGRPSQLYRRVTRLLGSRRYATPRVSYSLTAAGIVVLVTLLVLALHAPLVIAVTNSSPVAATQPQQPAASKWNGDLEYEQSQSFTVKPGDRLAVDVDRGNVHVTSWDKDQVGIVVRYKGKTNDELKQFLNHHTTNMTQNGDAVHIDARGDAWLSTASLRVEIDYEIQTPAKMSANVKDALGDVDVSALTAKLDVDVALGNVRLTGTTGTATANSSNGNVDAGQCTGTLKLSSRQGNVGITQFGGDSVDAQTAMGNVTADLPSAPKGDCMLKTEMGNISVKLPAAAGVNIHALTNIGTINSQFAEGANNGGGPTVTMEAKMGNVHVEKE